MGLLNLDGGVDAAGVELEPVKLIRGKGSNRAIGGDPELEGALGAVVREHGGTENFREITGGVASKGVHLPEAILGGDEALSDDEIIE